MNVYTLENKATMIYTLEKKRRRDTIYTNNYVCIHARKKNYEGTHYIQKRYDEIHHRKKATKKYTLYKKP